MDSPADIVIFGSGKFAARIALDLAATARQPVRAIIAARNAERLAWLETAGNARAALFGTPARLGTERTDLDIAGEAARVIARYQPKVVVQAASKQNPGVIATTGDAWSRLIATGGLSATALLQMQLTLPVARAVPPGCQFINCCFPDVVNGLLAALGLPIVCGTGNVSILATAFAGALGETAQDAVQILAHYQNLAPWRRTPAQRTGPAPRVWLHGQEIHDVFARFRSVQLTPEPAIEISGAAGVPLILAMASGTSWRGHAPGPLGLPGGYPVAWNGSALSLDLPLGLDQAEAVAWNARYEAESGLVIGENGRVRFTGTLQQALARESPDLANGFALADIEAAATELAELRDRLQGTAA